MLFIHYKNRINSRKRISLVEKRNRRFIITIISYNTKIFDKISQLSFFFLYFCEFNKENKKNIVECQQTSWNLKRSSYQSMLMSRTRLICFQSFLAIGNESHVEILLSTERTAIDTQEGLIAFTDSIWMEPFLITVAISLFAFPFPTILFQ